MYREILEEELRVKEPGYIYFIDKYHPLASKSNYLVYYHRHIASINLGRWISSEEEVHHIDGNKANNSWSNLEVLSKVEHGQLHALERGQALLLNKICTQCGKEFKPKLDRVYMCSVKCMALNQTKDKTITKESLEELMPFHTWGSLSKIFSYSDVGIKKRAKALGCDISLIKTYRK